MKNIFSSTFSIEIAAVSLCSCGSKPEPEVDVTSANTNANPVQETEQSAAAATPTAALSAAQESLKKGNFDDAAAKLAQLQMQGAKFNAQQAKDYRQTLSDAYDRAIEAAQRGDPRAQAALQMLRAAAPR